MNSKSKNTLNRRVNAGSLVPFDLSLFQKAQQNHTRWGKLHASEFKQRAVSQSSHQLWSFSSINNQSRVAQQRKAVIMSICANVPSRQWPTIILERLWTHKSQMYYEYESIVQMHTYVPPTTSLSSPTSRWTTKLSFFLRNPESREFPSICIHYRAAGQLAASFPFHHRLPTVWAPYIRQHVQGTVL